MLDLVLGELNLLPGPGRSDFQEASDNIVKNDVIHPRRRCHSTAVIQITARKRERERDRERNEDEGVGSNFLQWSRAAWLISSLFGSPKTAPFYSVSCGYWYGLWNSLLAYRTPAGFLPDMSLSIPKKPLWLNKIRKYRFKS